MNKIDPAVVQFANDAFYLAFNARDIDEMARLWASDTPCVCIHPGWQPIVGRDEILESWANIFRNQPEGGDIVCHEPRVLAQGNIFSVLCYEELPGGWLIATNNFVMERGNIHLFHHQAGQCMEPPTLSETVQTIQ